MVDRLRLLLSVVFGVMVLTACGITPQATFGLDVTLAGTGSGTVTSDPAGIEAGTLSADFTEGTEVTLTATADSGSSFTEWSGDCTGATCTVTMDAAKSVTATFAADAAGTETLSVGVEDNNGSTGTVTSDPAGISGAGSSEFTIGDTVELTASATTGGFFAWEGGDCDGSQELTCEVTIGAGEAPVTAVFNEVVSVTVQVEANDDDAEEFLGDANDTRPDYDAGYVEGFNYQSGQDLELGFDAYWEVAQAVGLRFLGPSVPTGARIATTVLGFTATDNVDGGATGGPAGSAGTMALTITGQASDAPSRFFNPGQAGYATFGITSRARTAASVPWSVSETWAAGTVYESADVTSIFEEIQARPGWSAGQPIVFILEPDSTASTEYRRAVSHDVDGNAAATLRVDYVADPAL